MSMVKTTLDKICLQSKGSIISGPFGSNISSKYFVEKGIPVIRGNNLSLSYDKFYDSGFVYITKEKADELKCYALKNDLIFTAAGTLGQVGLIPKDCMYEEYVISNKQIRVRLDNNKVDFVYAYYWFSSPFIQKILVKNNKGSTVPLLTLNEIKNLPFFYINDIEKQKKIVEILEYIYQKIQNNNDIITELGNMAKTVYMHYFFRKPYNGILADIIEEKPKSTIQVGDAKDIKGNFPFYTSGDAIYEWNNALADNRNCFLNTGGNADVKFYVGKAAYSTDTWCITGKDNLSDYLYLLLHTIKQELNIKYFMGTGLKHLQKDLLKKRTIYIPDEDELKAFNAIVMPAFNMIAEKTGENRELANLRDWLLPMLMNGQATVE